MYHMIVRMVNAGVFCIHVEGLYHTGMDAAVFLVGGTEATRRLGQGIYAYRDRHGLPWDILSAIAKDQDEVRLNEYRQRHPNRLVAVAGSLTPPDIASLRERHPSVLVLSTRNIPLGPGDWAVHVDDNSIGHQAIDHLLRCGYQHLASWGQWRGRDRKRRFAAAEQRCQELGHVFHRLILPPDSPDYQTSEDQLRELLAAQPKPLGIFAHDDLDAAWLREFCMVNGIDIPGEVGILGAGDDLALCTGSQPELSSVRLPWWQVGHSLAEVLHRQLCDGEPPAHKRSISAYGVSERSSTDLRHQQIVDPLVRRFVRLAATAALRGKGVGDLLSKLGCTQATLYRHVMPALGRSPSDYIRDVRVAKACDLLQDTELDVQEVAKRSGFATAKLLRTAFASRFPVTPGVWRKG